MFKDILNWKLLSGSHRFPGPDGGTCINEAAVVVAGLKYRAIANVGDCPPCFSNVISAYTIKLNDFMPDELRQELLIPFVTRLAGSADTLEIERQRLDLIIVRTVTDILPIVLRQLNLEEQALLCERVKTRAEVSSATSATTATCAASRAAYSAVCSTGIFPVAASWAADAVAHAVTSAASVDFADVPADAAAEAVAYAAAYTNSAISRQIWVKAADILDSALRIGKQAEPIETSVIIARAEAAKIHEAA